MAYGSISGASALVPAAGELGATSTPTSAQVAAWLAQGSAKIDRALSSAGYFVPVSVVAGAYQELEALANLYAAAYILIARGMDSSNGEAENRSNVWLERFDVDLQAIAASNLIGLGVTVVTSTTAPRSRVRTLQLRRIDGYSALATGEDWTE